MRLCGRRWLLRRLQRLLPGRRRNRLRLRHGPYAVTPAQRDRWLTHMLAALDSLGLAAEDDAELRDYLTRAAQFMVNSFDEE